MPVPEEFLPECCAIAWSPHTAGDAWPSLELRRVMLIELNSRMPEIPPHNTRGVRRHWNKFTWGMGVRTSCTSRALPATFLVWHDLYDAFQISYGTSCSSGSV